VPARVGKALCQPIAFALIHVVTPPSCGSSWLTRETGTKMIRLGERSIHVLHDIHELEVDPVSCGVDVVISGHSHRPRIEAIHGVLYLNPGSVGPRRFNLTVTLAILGLTKSGPRPFIHHLGSGSTY